MPSVSTCHLAVCFVQIVLEPVQRRSWCLCSVLGDQKPQRTCIVFVGSHTAVGRLINACAMKNARGSVSEPLTHHPRFLDLAAITVTERLRHVPARTITTPNSSQNVYPLLCPALLGNRTTTCLLILRQLQFKRRPRFLTLLLPWRSSLNYHNRINLTTFT